MNNQGARHVPTAQQAQMEQDEALARQLQEQFMQEGRR
jgi:hypothetical protein